MTQSKTDQAAATVRHWLTQHPGRAAAARFPIDELWTLLDERTDQGNLVERIADDCAQRAGYYDHPEIWLPESQAPDAIAARAMQQAWATAARLIRAGEIPGELVQAATSDIDDEDGAQ